MSQQIYGLQIVGVDLVQFGLRILSFPLAAICPSLGQCRLIMCARFGAAVRINKFGYLGKLK